jgi:hypothetical protein
MQGDCYVNVIDEFNREHVAIKLLVEGEQFGEIGVMYNCKRTASVYCRKYNTTAVLSKQGFN